LDLLHDRAVPRLPALAQPEGGVPRPRRAGCAGRRSDRWLAHPGGVGEALGARVPGDGAARPLPGRRGPAAVPPDPPLVQRGGRHARLYRRLAHPARLRRRRRRRLRRRPRDARARLGPALTAAPAAIVNDCPGRGWHLASWPAELATCWVIARQRW